MLSQKKSVVLAGIFGNALEWYDFTVYAFFVPIIASLFFPGEDPVLSLLKTFGVFAIGFLVRPIGALFFGYVGDHWGRRKALILSMIVMSVPTFCLGLLPTYQHIGVLAPLLLTLLRIIQGMAVSGELTTASSFLIEHAAPNQRGFAGSLAMGSAFIGIVLSSAIASTVTEFVSDSELYIWGWRIPFLLGGLIGVIGIVIRLRTTDPEIFENKKISQNTTPTLWQHLMTLNYKIVFKAILLTAVMAMCNYLLIGYFNTFLIKEQNLPMREVMIINFIALTILTFLMPFMAHLSDKIGRKVVLGSGLVGFIIFSYPIFWLLTQQNIYSAFYGELLFAITLAPIAGLIPTLLAELFDTYNRNTGLSVSYNLSQAFFGGTAPLVAMTLVAKTTNFYAPAGYIILLAFIAFVTLLTIPENFNKPLL
jgi:proline/betaine transport protein TphA